ncbi:DUF401 family protein [Chloroflexota bacterium]
MLSPSIALLISIVCILVLLRLRLHPGYAIFVGGVVISLTAMPVSAAPSLLWQAFWNFETLTLLVVVVAALAMSSIMQQKGLLLELAGTMEKVTPKLAIHVIPAVIGLVPMPAGAVVSATAGGDLSKKLGLNPEQSTFTNYWFRHIWELSLPVYSNVIAASILLRVSLSTMLATMFPMTVLAVLSGLLVSWWTLRKAPLRTGKRPPIKTIIYKLFRASWPILLLVIMVLAGLEAIIAFPVVLALLAIVQRASLKQVGKALRQGADYKILFLVYAVIFYKIIIESSDAALSVFSDMQMLGVPVMALLVILPLLIGFITGVSIAYVGISFPLLLPIIAPETGINHYALLLAFTSGIVGMHLSPLHLCLVLSAEYFKARLINVFKYLVPPSLLMVAVAVLLYFFLG